MNELKMNNARMRQRNEMATPRSPSPTPDVKVIPPKFTFTESTKYRDRDKSRYITFYLKL